MNSSADPVRSGPAGPPSPPRLLTTDQLAGWATDLADSDSAYAAAYPGPPGPGPVHTVYVPVPRFTEGIVAGWSAAAVAAIDTEPQEWLTVLAEHSGLDQAGVAELDRKTRAKLAAEPFEDLRIDFEDGFRAHRGTPADDLDEDAHALRAAAAVEVMAGIGSLPRSWGLRIRSLGPLTRERGLRTLDLFLGRLLESHGRLPAGFVITLPKVTSLEQVVVFAAVLAAIESAAELAPGSIPFEIQVETPQTVLGADGRVPVAAMIHAAGGRVSGLHFGTYDYTASLGILGAYQNLRHPVADFAKQLMMLAAAETGVRVSDGSDNKVPVGSAEEIGRRWAAHADGVRRALRSGIYQGWDLHPAQLPTRFAATFAFFRLGWVEAARRLADYHHSVTTGVLDEPATAFALARHLAAALSCGAVEAAELLAVAGIDADVVEQYLIRGAVPGGRST
ncbi:aldolase [Nakamurella silvestris]|nr:aldolase [Nakamurella silvestris]